jgi:hypothetical protein
MDRRGFIGALVGGLLTAPLAAEAQRAEGKVYRIDESAGLLRQADSDRPELREMKQRFTSSK